MLRPTLVTLTLLSVALAGCSGGGGGNTALSLQDTAEDAALKVRGDTVLVAIFSAEWTNESFGDEFQDESPEAAAMDQGVDPDPGDGEANAWAYLFVSGEHHVLVIVGAGGDVLHAEVIAEDTRTAESYGDTDPLTGVEVDSDEAAAIVAENDANFTAITEREDVVVVMALAQDDSYGGPYWVLTAFSGEDDDHDEDFVFALVNASTGEYVPLPFFND